MNKFTSIFSQMLTLFPRLEFEKAVKETKAEQHAKGFTSWGQFISIQRLLIIPLIQNVT